MSAKIAVRVGGDVLEVPPIRLNWATEHPALMQLIDQVDPLFREARPDFRPTSAEVGLITAWLAELLKVIGCPDRKLDADVVECRWIYLALRGVYPPDPTPRSPDGSDT